MVYAISTVVTSCNDMMTQLPNPTIYEDVDFKYSLHNQYGMPSEVFFEGLTQVGKSKKIIIVPSEIDGKHVQTLSYTNRSRDKKKTEPRGMFESTNLESLYITSGKTYVGIDNVFEGCPSLKKIVFQDVETKSIGRVSIKTSQKIFISSYNRNEQNVTAVAGVNEYEYTYYYANISYIYNYEDAVNEGYYWVDNFEYGEKIGYIPNSPARLGYTFTGWYKEAECITKWDFETDTLPKAEYNEKGEEVYQETKLYAGWQETETNE